MLQPDRHQQRDMLVADERAAARQEHARKDGSIPAALPLMQEAVLGRELDVADAETVRPAARAFLLACRDYPTLQLLQVPPSIGWL